MPFSENFYKKIKHLLPTLVTVPIGANLIIIFLRWVDDTYLHTNFIEEESWSLLVPLCINPIIIWFFIVPKIRAFKFPKEQNSGIFVYSFLIYFWLTFVCGFTQTYYTNASNTITTLQHVEQIKNYPPSRYYRIKKGNLERVATANYINYYTSGKGGTLNMDIYFVMPIISPGKLNPWSSKYWYGVTFHKEIKNSIAAARKDSIAKSFFLTCREELNTYTIARAPYLILSPNSKASHFFMKAIQKRTGIMGDQPIVLIHPKNEDFKKRNDSILLGLVISFFLGLFVALIPAFSKKTTFLNEDVPELTS